MTFSDKRLIVFGDSWPKGAELGPGEKTFGELISEQLGFKSFENYSAPASTIPHMIVQFKSFLSKLESTQVNPNEYVALFSLTAQERGMTYYDGEWIFHTATGGFSLAKNRDISSTMNNHYWKYFYSPEQAELTANTSIVCLQSLCQYHGIQDYYVAGWQKFNCWPEINLERFYEQGQVSTADFINVTVYNGQVNRANPYIWPNQSKPNQSGHIEIARRLTEWMSRA